MGKGIVKWFDDKKGYGFIQSDEGGTSLFITPPLKCLDLKR